VRGWAGSSVPSRTGRRLVIVALWLTLGALLVTLQFVYKTTGGTLFLFTTVAPTLVLISIGLLIGVFLYEYRRAHRLFTIEAHEAGETIFREGDEGGCAYFIRSGEVEVLREGGGTILTTLGKGDYFGEMALISNSPRSATIRTVSSVELAVLGKENFLGMMKLLPKTEKDILNTVRERAMRAGDHQ
jgi:hypothetical protein